MKMKNSLVLFADRHVRWARGLKAELERRGARVMSVTSLDAALDLMAFAPPAVIVLGDDIENQAPHLLIDRVRNRAPRAALAILFSNPPEPAADETWREMGLLYEGPRPADSCDLRDLILGALEGAPARKPRGGTILCVDDDALYLRSLSRLIERDGYRVAAFEDGQRALEALPEMGADLAIVDVMMPGLNGLSLTEQIREAYGDALPIVLLTGRGGDQDIVEGYRRGASYYITKPCEARTVLNIVDYLVGNLDERERRILELQL